MAFICEACHTGPREGLCGIRGSYGPCEGCGKSATCADCHCRTPVKPKKPIKKKVATR